MKTIKTAVLLAVFCLLTGMGYAQTPSTDVPKTITYQGMINAPDGTPIADGQYNITVTFYADAAGTSRVWQGTYPATVTKGIFNVMLGSGASPFATTAMFNQPLWVGVKVGDGDEMRPLSQLSSAPSALGIADSSITSPKMATPYVAGITVNGTPITGVGSTVNLVGAGATSLLYDQQTNSIIVNAAGTGTTRDSGGNGGLKNGGANTEGIGNAVQDGPGVNGIVNKITMWSQINAFPGIDWISNSSMTENLGGSTLTTTDATFNVNSGGGGAAQYQDNGVTILTAPATSNVFVGPGVGVALAGGVSNTGVGDHALNALTLGVENTAVGDDALTSNTDGGGNTGIGDDALNQNVHGQSNTAVGDDALHGNTNSNNNTSMGRFSLSGNAGDDNSAYGFQSMNSNGAGIRNTAVGSSTMMTNTIGTNNSVFGYHADVSVNNLTNATAIGANAIVGASNSLVLGSGANVGIGTSTPSQLLEVDGNVLIASTGAANQLQFQNPTSTFISTFQAGVQTVNLNYTLPTAIPAGITYLSNNGAGVLSWTAAGPGVTSVTASAPLASSGGATPNISLAGIVGVANGGTGDNTLTAHGVLLGEGTSPVAISAAMTAGQLLVGQSATSDPSPETIAQDMTLAASGNATVVGIQTIPVSATAPTLNQVLQYNGTSWVPTTFSPGGVTAVSASAPLASSGGATPNITVTPGANNTFLTTNNVGAVGFNPLDVDGITLLGDGSNTALAINLDNPNIWTNKETFAPSAAHNVTSMLIKETAAGVPANDIMTVEDAAAANTFLRVERTGDVEISNNANIPAANSHIHAGGTTVPPVIIGPGVVAAASALQDNDIAGVVNFGMGGVPGAAGNQIGICMNRNYPAGSTVAVVISGTDINSANLNPYAVYTIGGCGGGSDQITIGTGNPPAPHTTYTFAYHVMYLR